MGWRISLPNRRFWSKHLKLESPREIGSRAQPASLTQPAGVGTAHDTQQGSFGSASQAAVPRSNSTSSSSMRQLVGSMRGEQSSSSDNTTITNTESGRKNARR